MYDKMMHMQASSAKFTGLSRCAFATTLAVAFASVVLLGGCPANEAPPEPTTLTPATGPEAGGTKVTIRGSGFASASGVLFGEQTATAFTVVNDRLITAVTPANAPGSVEVTILGPTPPPEEFADLTSALPRTDIVAGTFEYLGSEPAPRPTPPTLVAIEPAAGPLAGGTTVTITGTDLRSGSTVLFGERLASTATVDTDTLITATTPAQAAPGAVDVILVSPDGTRTALPGAFEYQASAGPGDIAGTELVPNRGATAGGTVVTISGSGFEPRMGVLIDGRQAADVEFVNSELLVAVTPAGEPGLATLVLETADGRTAELPDAFEYFVARTDPGTDSDGDGLTDLQETTGHEIRLDLFGFGMDPRHLIARQVSSDPTDADSDDDGLDDRAELLNRADPRAADTDGDGLFDNEEVVRWLTSPVSVDTDGDARGPLGDLPPNAALFDGGELVARRDAQGRLVDAAGNRFVDADGQPLPPRDIVRVVLAGTSPTLDDTDGDGATDYEEFDDPVRSSIVADIPQARVRIVDDVRASLFVEYAESIGSETEYGSTLSQSTTQTLSTADTLSNSTTVSASATLGLEISATPGVSGEATAGVSFTEENSTTWTEETATETQQTFSQYQRESRELEEVAARGALRMGVQITNIGNIAYKLRNLAFTVRQFVPTPDDPDRTGSYRTVGTLQPTIPDLTLAPEGSTDVIEVAATDVNPTLIKQFLARPSAFSYNTVGFELENAAGINFAFLTENTYSRTALVVIDYGDGTFDKFRIATNVDRDPDTAAFTGVDMRRVMQEILDIEYETTDPATAGGAFLDTIVQPDGTRLESDFQYARWVVFGSPGMDVAGTDFEDIVLRNRDEIRLVYIQDADEDGLFAREEFVHGTSDTTPHSDRDPSIPGDTGDGLTDYEEIRVGWDVTVGGETFHVLSDPRSTDADGDGLDDAAERAAGTNPNDRDTDVDGLSDGVDAHPTIRAGRLYVWGAASGANDGSTWADALTSVVDAAARATTLNSNADPADDISEIWVAAGVYTGGVTVPSDVALYGGFAGGETRLGQRDPNPATNGCILSGGSEVAILDGVGPATVFDGFVLSGGNDGLEVNNTVVELRNLLIVGNSRGIDLLNGAELTLRDSIVSGNGRGNAPGIHVSDSTLLAEDVEIVDNVSDAARTGAALHAQGSSDVTLRRCRVMRNTSALEVDVEATGGVYLDTNATFRAVNTSFRQNVVYRGGGGAMLIYGDALVINCTFWANQTQSGGRAGAVFVARGSNQGPGRFYAINCTFEGNQAGGNQAAGGVFVSYDSTTGPPSLSAAYLWNCILYNNSLRGIGANEMAQVGGRSGSSITVRNSIVSDNLSTWVGNGNLGADPRFENPATGNLKLAADSPAIDLGNNLVDADPFTPGLQFLPDQDLARATRVVDGDGNGTPRVDMGAYEYQVVE